MADDTLPTQKIDPLEARVVVFRQQPEARSFAALRQELRDAGRGELLADVCATWAPHERDPIRAAGVAQLLAQLREAARVGLLAKHDHPRLERIDRLGLQRVVGHGSRSPTIPRS